MSKAENELKKFERFGSKLGLERMKELLFRLGDPQKDLKVIHVAGTNGKGSVCEFLAGVIHRSGYSVGLYTSPYIVDFHERIKLNGEMISEGDLNAYTEKVISKADEMVADALESPTEFEVITAVAFMYFKGKNPDFVIMEVGLGGRGDSTNVIENPLLSVITSISLDHTDRLGESIEEIAFEKAGIIKPGCAVICGADDPKAKRVIAERAYELGAALTDASSIKPVNVTKAVDKYSFSVEISGRKYTDIEISMLGEHQIRNAICTLTVVDFLRTKKLIRTEKETLLAGMREAKQPGRFEIFGKVILDGAHNAAGAKALRMTMEDLFAGKKVLTVVGMLSDKNSADIIDELNVFTCEYIATEPPVARKLDAEDLASHMGNVDIITSPQRAYEVAMDRADKFDVVLFVGSLYLIGYIRNLRR